jgi:hypothetical protein
MRLAIFNKLISPALIKTILNIHKHIASSLQFGTEKEKKAIHFHLHTISDILV